MKVASKIKPVNGADFMVADAEDIALDGENASTAIIKIKYRFKNVEAIKNCGLNFNKGEVIQTLGFYNENDGGGATYIITDENLTTDEMFVIGLGNLKLKLIFDNAIDVRKLGFKDSQVNNVIFDNTPLFLKLNNYVENTNKHFTIIFPSGWFGFSSGANWNRINKMGCYIKGSAMLGEIFRDGLNGNDCSIGTVFFAIDKAQEYIIKFGGKLIPNKYSNLEYVNIKNITFWGGTCSIVDGKFSVERFADGCKEMLIFDYCSFCKYDNLTFSGGIGVINCLRVKGYEHFVGTLIFRDVGQPGVFNSCIRFEKGTDTNYEVVPSGSIISNISMENCAGSILDFNSCVEITVNTISSEISNLNCTKNKITNSETILNKSKLSLIKFANTFGAININSITCQHLGKYVYDNYCYNTLLYNYDDYGYGTGVNIGTVNIESAGYEMMVLDYKANNLDSSYSVPYTEPSIAFNNILTTAEEINYKILDGLQVIKPNVVQNIVRNDNNTNNIIYNKLTPLNSRYPSRIAYDNNLKMFYSTPLITDFKNADSRVQSKFLNVTHLYQTNTNIYLQVQNLKGYVILDKYGDSSKTCRIKLHYADGTETNVDVVKSSGGKTECLTFTLPVSPNKLITALIVEQVEERKKDEYEYLKFFELMLQI